VLGSFQAPPEINIRRAIQLAESISPCVLWIDEIEKGFSAHLVSGREASGAIARALPASGLASGAEEAGALEDPQRRLLPGEGGLRSLCSI
jgi:hypothetical protein